jgi:hypothetical protein
LGVKDFDGRVGFRVRIDAGSKFHLPDALTSISTVLLKNARTVTKTRGEPLIEVVNRSIQVSVCPPPQRACDRATP